MNILLIPAVAAVFAVLAVPKVVQATANRIPVPNRGEPSRCYGVDGHSAEICCDHAGFVVNGSSCRCACHHGGAKKGTG